MRVALAAPCASLALSFAALWLAVPVHAQGAHASPPLAAEASEPEPVDPGGIWSNLAYGGQYMGRGIRARRYIGRIKLVGQTELRAMLYGRPDKLSILTFAFLDAGYVGVSYRHFGGDRAQLLLGFGGGVGIYWGRSFVLRFDVATSALEDYAPYYYLTLTHPY